MFQHKIFSWLSAISLVYLASTSLPAQAWDMVGTKIIKLHGRDAQAVAIGTVSFVPKGKSVSVTVKMDHAKLKDYFLSMREFKCLDGAAEVQCHVPYPYANPATVTATDLVWLEHALLFFYKAPKDFGANWWNGLYYQLKLTESGLVGTPQAIDLNVLGVPPANLSVPPYTASERSDILPEARWFNKLTIE